MKRTLLVVFVSFAILLGGIDLIAGPASAQEGAHPLDGYVCSWDWGTHVADECRGTGLPEATVTLTRAGEAPLGLDDFEGSETTDAEGWFHFDGLEEGEYEMVVERDGFEPLERSITVPDEAKVQVSLAGESVDVSGEVLAEDGSAVAGAELFFSHRQAASAESGDDGSFQVTLTAGHHSIQVHHPDQRTLRTFDLVDGSAMTFTLEDAPERTATVEGVVTDQHGTPVADATVEVYQYGYDDCCIAYAEPAPAEAEPDPADGGGQDAPASQPARYPYYDDGYQRTTTDAQGRYSLDVYAGWVNLNVWMEGHAHHSEGFEVQDGESREHDVELQKYPEKTARVEGRVTSSATGDGLQWVSISIESPQYGLYECSRQAPDETSASDGPGSGSSSGDAGSAEPQDGDALVASEPYPYPGPYNDGCAITVHPDGSFEGTVTPGYSILRVNYQHYRSCTETQHADGSYTRECGRDHFQHVQVLDLPANATTQVDVALTARPAPDAVIQGWALDAESQNALQGVRVSFSNQDTYGYAWATTDEDGSFKVRVRSGYHQVSVYHDGYLRWEGIAQVASGDTHETFIDLVQGEDRYGGCCYHYAEDAAASDGAPRPAGAPAPDGTASGEAVADGDASSQDAQAFEDLGGGLGPYDPSKRSDGDTEGLDIPGPAPFLVVGALGALALLRRRRG